MIDGFISRRLSGKLLLMTIAFVMIAEILIFIPSAAVFRQSWLEDRAERAGHLTLALTGVPDYEGSEILSRQFMEDTDVVMLATKREGMTELVLGNPPSDMQYEKVDLRDMTRLTNLKDTFRIFFGDTSGHFRVLAEPLVEGQEVLEYIVPKSSLHEALRDYCHRILLLSILIAIITGVMLYLALSMMIVRPVRKLAEGLSAFREDPETRRSNLPPSRRQDEIGQLQREFYDMKQSVRAAFKQQDRLADLGLAVAKINHDLRNVLTSAQLVSDRLAMDKEERVSRMGARLVRAIDRGVKLCAEVLDYSQVKDDALDMEDIRISLLLGEVAADVLEHFGSGPRAINFRNLVPTEMTVFCDPDHTYRIFHNLFRNAAQAMAAVKEDDAERYLTVKPNTRDPEHIDVTDTGPGLPKKAQDNLFKAFTGSSGIGNTGLGLTISKDLAKSQGGDLVLSDTHETGTTFTVSFDKPPQPG